MACLALLSDIRAIAGIDAPVFSPPPGRPAVVWMAAFAAMSSLPMALRLDDPGASDLAEWLRVAERWKRVAGPIAYAFGACYCPVF